MIVSFSWAQNNVIMYPEKLMEVAYAISYMEEYLQHQVPIRIHDVVHACMYMYMHVHSCVYE